MKKNEKRDILRALSMISQFGISMITPILLCVLLARFMINRFFSGQSWIIVLGVILGAASSVYSMVKLVKMMSNSEKDE